MSERPVRETSDPRREDSGTPVRKGYIPRRPPPPSPSQPKPQPSESPPEKSRANFLTRQHRPAQQP